MEHPDVKIKTYICPDKPISLFLKDEKWGYLSENGQVYLSGKKILDGNIGTSIFMTPEGNLYISSFDGITFYTSCTREMKKSKDSIPCTSFCLDKSGTIYAISKGDIVRKVDGIFEKVIVGGFDGEVVSGGKQRYQLGYDYKRDMLMILDCKRNRLFWYMKTGSYFDVLDLSFMRIIDGSKIWAASAFDCDKRGKIVVGYHGGFIRVFEERVPTTLLKCRASVRDIKLSDGGEIYASYFNTNEIDVLSFEVFSSLSSSSSEHIESF